jgi:outer membrane lipoprotein
MTGPTYLIRVLFISCLLAHGCAPVISKELREQVDSKISYAVVNQNPSGSLGQMVIWGGVIIGAKNREDGTLLEILQKPCDFEGRPEETDASEGRFLALYDGYLDAAIYTEGREVTIAGRIKGERTLPLGEIEYVYPLISAEEIYLWKEKSKEMHYYYPPPYPAYYPRWYDYPYWWRP